jgi:hypothetical protein
VTIIATSAKVAKKYDPRWHPRTNPTPNIKTVFVTPSQSIFLPNDAIVWINSSGDAFTLHQFQFMRWEGATFLVVSKICGMGGTIQMRWIRCCHGVVRTKFCFAHLFAAIKPFRFPTLRVLYIYILQEEGNFERRCRSIAVTFATYFIRIVLAASANKPRQIRLRYSLHDILGNLWKCWQL